MWKSTLFNQFERRNKVFQFSKRIAGDIKCISWVVWGRQVTKQATPEGETQNSKSDVSSERRAAHHQAFHCYSERFAGTHLRWEARQGSPYHWGRRGASGMRVPPWDLWRYLAQWRPPSRLPAAANRHTGNATKTQKFIRVFLWIRSNS